MPGKRLTSPLSVATQAAWTPQHSGSTIPNPTISDTLLLVSPWASCKTKLPIYVTILKGIHKYIKYINSKSKEKNEKWRNTSDPLVHWTAFIEMPGTVLCAGDRDNTQALLSWSFHSSGRQWSTHEQVIAGWMVIRKGKFGGRRDTGSREYTVQATP